MKKQEEKAVRCIDCKLAVLQRWDNNPVVAYCNHYRVREVANTLRRCQHFICNPSEPQVMQLTRF